MSVSEPGSSLISCQSSLNLLFFSSQINVGVWILCGSWQICYFLGNDNMNLKLVLTISGHLRLHDLTNSNFLKFKRAKAELESIFHIVDLDFVLLLKWTTLLLYVSSTQIFVQFFLNILLITAITAHIPSAITNRCVWTHKRCKPDGLKDTSQPQN